jgi:hypothetical protein
MPSSPPPAREAPRQLRAATKPAIRLVATAGSGRGSPVHRAYQVKRPPIPRRRIHDIYWSFASERQAAFERRLAGRPFPWTEDPDLAGVQVLQCVPRCRPGLPVHDPRSLPPRRAMQPRGPDLPDSCISHFSKIDTWTAVRAFLGHYPTLGDLADEGFREALDHARRQNGGLYTGAFILCANNAYGRSCKHLNHVDCSATCSCRMRSVSEFWKRHPSIRSTNCCTAIR